MSRERLSPQQWARLETELRKGPLAHGFANDQQWTLGRVKALIGRLFHVGYTIEGSSSTRHLADAMAISLDSGTGPRVQHR